MTDKTKVLKDAAFAKEVDAVMKKLNISDQDRRGYAVVTPNGGRPRKKTVTIRLSSRS